ncbi:MAG: DUF1353 domain-containing protein [Planctomycetales bacterium]|nr:DUF1353 domain-containing protein [Planctomycetales bacterium]
MAATFGRFKGDVIALWLPDGRNMQLTQTFVYVDPRGKEWVAPKDSVVNGASIPGTLWSTVGGPYEGQYRNASVVHDVACEEMTSKWEDVHNMFYEACRCGGVSLVQAKTLYYAVYNFGPRWQDPTLRGVGPHGAVRSFGAGGPTAHATQPVAVDPHDLRAVMEYIQENNPTLAELRNLSPDTARASALSRAAVNSGAKKKKPKKKPKG